MAMISCRECGAQISNEATCCPQCGCPVVKEKKKRKRPVIIAIAVVLLIVVIFLKYAVDDHLIFLSADSRMEYYFMTDLRSSDSGERSIEYFNKKYAGTTKEETAVELLKTAIVDAIDNYDYLSTLSAYKIAAGLNTDNSDIVLLREVTAFLSKETMVGDILNSPSEYYGDWVHVFARLDGVDGDRGCITFDSYDSYIECFYNHAAYSGADWDNNRNRNGGVVLAFGRIQKYSNSNNAYMQMSMSIDLQDYSGWEKIEAINEFRKTLETFGYPFE